MLLKVVLDLYKKYYFYILTSVELEEINCSFIQILPLYSFLRPRPNVERRLPNNYIDPLNDSRKEITFTSILPI